jgi:Zn-dependent peptidase ImmA (M78 family)
MIRRWTRPTLLAALGEKMQQHGYDTTLAYPVDPFRIARRERIEVHFQPLEDLSLSALLFHDEHDARATLNSNTPLRHVFSMMHELIHFWFHPCPGLHFDRHGSRALVDVQANYAAAEALMPATMVRRVARELDYDVRYTAHAFGVSQQAMAIRFDELRLLVPQNVIPFRTR